MYPATFGSGRISGSGRAGGRRRNPRATADEPCGDSTPDSLPLFIRYREESGLHHLASNFIGKDFGFLIPPRMHLQMIGWGDRAEIEVFAAVLRFVVFENHGPPIETGVTTPGPGV